MDRLKHALEEALKRNDDETIRWQKYQGENKQAIDNLKTFAKKLEVDIMVPIGNKAFMPGKLCHPSEILVSHYRGYFSKLSSIQAQELLNRRLEMGKKRLDDLEKEREMYQNKLEVPYADGALPTEGERDIIEEVTEEEYKRQQEEHKIKVREYHQKKSAAKKDEPEESSHDDYINRLEDLELLEELEEELEKLEIDDDEKLEKLLSGEIKLPAEKKRISHATDKSDDSQKSENSTENNTSQDKSENSEDNVKSLTSKNFIESMEVDTKLMKDVMAALQASNRDIPNKPQIETSVLASSNAAQKTVGDISMQEDNVKSKDDTVPANSNTTQETVNQIAKPEDNKKASSKPKNYVAQNFSKNSPSNKLNKNSISPVSKEPTPKKISPNNSIIQQDDDDDRHPDIIKMESEIITMTSQEKLEYYRNRLKIYEEKVVIVKSVEDLERKCTQLEIIDHIKDAIEMLKHTIYEEQKASKKSLENRKRISFAAEDEVHFIDSSAAVSSVNKKKDFIEKITFEEVEEPTVPEEVDKKKLILEKVEKNLEFVAETQSRNDFDIVGKIIGKQEQESKTLYLHFEHSSNRFTSPGYSVDVASDDDKTIGSPADIYKMFPQYLPALSFEQPIITSPTSKEPNNNNNNDKTDIILNFSDNKTTNTTENNDQSNNNVEATEPVVDNNKPKEDVATQGKSILKNKELVKQEKHLPIQSEEDKENNQRKSKGKKKSQTTFKPIMGEVVERPKEEPDPLPPGKLIDAHAPKKRISRFKQARQNQ